MSIDSSRLGIDFFCKKNYNFHKNKFRQILFDNSDKIVYTEIRTHVRTEIEKGELKIMSENKAELIKLILENDNLEQAVLTASAIIFDYLKQYESSQEQIAVCQ